MWAFILIKKAPPNKVKLHQLHREARNQTDLKMDAADSFKEQHVAITFHFRGKEGFSERNRNEELWGKGGCN